MDSCVNCIKKGCFFCLLFVFKRIFDQNSFLGKKKDECPLAADKQTKKQSQQLSLSNLNWTEIHST